MSNSTRTVLVWVLIVALIATLMFYFGFEIGTITAVPPSGSASTGQTTSTTTTNGYYSDPAQWQSYTDTAAGYSIAFPIDLTVDEPSSIAPSTDWRMNNADQSPGIKTFTLTVPGAFEPQTNFVDATLTVGYSQDQQALADCLMAQNGEATSSDQSVNNATFSVFTMSSPGAGNLYDTTSYRTTHASACYAVDYTIHSAQLENFPASYQLQKFNEGEVEALLNNIVGTFTFL